VAQALLLLHRELAFFKRLKIAVLVKPVGLEFPLDLFPPAVEMRLALDEFGGAACKAGALHVEFLQGLPLAVVYGPDVVPVPVDRFAVTGFQG
jgi:hypothetical protein